MTQEERDNLLLDMQSDNKKRDELLLEISTQLKEHNNQFSEIQDKLEVIHANIGSLDAKFNKLDARVDDLSGSVIVMEKEHGDKIQLLIDMVSEPFGDNSVLREKIDDHKDWLYEHDVRIGVLESKVSNS